MSAAIALSHPSLLTVLVCSQSCVLAYTALTHPCCQCLAAQVPAWGGFMLCFRAAGNHLVARNMLHSPRKLQVTHSQTHVYKHPRTAVHHHSIIHAPLTHISTCARTHFHTEGWHTHTHSTCPAMAVHTLDSGNILHTLDLGDNRG